MRRVALVILVLAGCSRDAPSDDPPVPWKPPPTPTWDALPKSDDAALALGAKHATSRPGLAAYSPRMLAYLEADATKLVAGEDAIAAAYDSWANADATKPAYLVFGTLHDSRAQIEAAASIVLRMKSAWGLALEQFRAAGRWSGAPAVDSADDADLASLDRPNFPLDRDALARVDHRQALLDHAAWKFGYLDAMSSLVRGARGAGVPLLACDMPTELRGAFTPGGEGERALRELHCARALRDDALASAQAHAPDGGLSDDDAAPPERYGVIVGARHAEPDGLARFFDKAARVALVRVLGGRPKDAPGDEVDLAPRLVVTDEVLVRERGVDLLLLPDETWGGSVDRASDRGEVAPRSVAGLPRPNLDVTSDASARFAITDASVDVAEKPEWLTIRAGHHAYVLVSSERTFVGAVDVPELGWTELHFTPHDRALRVVVHRP
ncbi:MAG TPA: hypothetical protein VGH28_02855 [Polyangiaceae bacterium]|jgi:hypothetical protein